MKQHSWIGVAALIVGSMGCDAGADEEVSDSDPGSERTSSGASSGGNTSGGEGGNGPEGQGGDPDDDVSPGGDDDGAVPPVAPRPPVGGAACSDEAPGSAVGDFAENFVLMDQGGRMVSLSDYCGQVVYIPLGAMWCPGCQSSAEQIPTKMAEYGDQGFVVLNLMAETPRGAEPDQDALTTWAETYDLTTPVLADVDWGVWERYWPTHSTPKNLLIGRDGRLAAVGWVGERDIQDAL